MRPSTGTPGDLPTALAVARMFLSFGGDAAPAVATPRWDDAARRAAR